MRVRMCVLCSVCAHVFVCVCAWRDVSPPFIVIFIFFRIFFLFFFSQDHASLLENLERLIPVDPSEGGGEGGDGEIEGVAEMGTEVEGEAEMGGDWRGEWA